jgi:hypothetical protein
VRIAGDERRLKHLSVPWSCIRRWCGTSERAANCAAHVAQGNNRGDRKRREDDGVFNGGLAVLASSATRLVSDSVHAALGNFPLSVDCNRVAPTALQHFAETTAILAKHQSVEGRLRLSLHLWPFPLWSGVPTAPLATPGLDQGQGREAHDPSSRGRLCLGPRIREA